MAPFFFRPGAWRGCRPPLCAAGSSVNTWARIVLGKCRRHSDRDFPALLAGFPCALSRLEEGGV